MVLGGQPAIYGHALHGKGQHENLWEANIALEVPMHFMARAMCCAGGFPCHVGLPEILMLAVYTQALPQPGVSLGSRG